MTTHNEYSTLDKFRERAMAHHARNIALPANINDPKRIATGKRCSCAPGRSVMDDWAHSLVFGKATMR